MKKKGVLIRDLKMGEINEISHEFYASGLIYRVNFEKLSLHFLSKAWQKNIWDLPFKDLRKKYVEDMGEDDVPKTKEAFFAYIVQFFFGYDKEPGQELLINYMKATDHLKEVDERIKIIELEITAIREANLQTDIQTKIPVLSYFLKHNKDARESIIEFLKGDIYNYSLNQSDINMRGLFAFGQTTYNYAWNPKAYEIKYPSLISNKFGILEISKYRKIKQLFDSDRPEFQKFLTEFISEQEIVFLIRESTTEKHLLNARADIINAALSAFEAGNRILFASICVFIIEGIFHDVCLLLGAKENDLLGAGFQEKVNQLQRALGIDFNYEYYSFQFRHLRNKMAHGLLEGKEAEEVADLLLLDLEDAIKITRSLKIPLNQKLFFFHEATTGKLPVSFNYIMAYLFLKNVQIPPFYKIDQQKIIDILRTAEFWKLIDSYLEGDVDSKSIAFAVIGAVKDLKDEELNEPCVKRLKSKPGGLKTIFKQQFIDSLIH